MKTNLFFIVQTDIFVWWKEQRIEIISSEERFNICFEIDMSIFLFKKKICIFNHFLRKTHWEMGTNTARKQQRKQHVFQSLPAVWLLPCAFCLSGFLNMGGKYDSHNITWDFSLLGPLSGWPLGESPDGKNPFKSITPFLSLQHLLTSSGVFTGSNITAMI